MTFKSRFERHDAISSEVSARACSPKCGAAEGPLGPGAAGRGSMQIPNACGRRLRNFTQHNRPCRVYEQCFLPQHQAPHGSARECLNLVPLARYCANVYLYRSLGQDFGCLSSKATLAWKQLLADTISILRVTLTADRHHPERRTIPNASHSEFEFISYAALGSDGLIIGRQALGADERFPLKTAFGYCAGFPRRNVRDMPRGRPFLRLFDRGLVTWEMLDKALYDHFALLREMALAKAEDAGLEIVEINCTYPDFIWETSEDWDLSDKYQRYYRSMMRRLWGHSIRIQMSMEGHTTGVYVYEPFEDALSSVERTRLSEQFSGLDLQEGLILVVVDSGSSTLVCIAAPGYATSCSHYLEHPDTGTLLRPQPHIYEQPIHFGLELETRYDSPAPGPYLLCNILS